MAIGKGIKQFLKTVKSKEAKKRNKNTLKDIPNEQFMKTVTSKEVKKRNKKGVIGEKMKNVSPSLAGALGISVGASQVKEMKSGGVVSSKSKSSGVALKGFGKEIK